MEKGTVCNNFYVTQFKQLLLYLIDCLTKRFHLQNSNLIFFNSSASSLLLLLNIYRKYLIESGLELICNTENTFCSF